MWARCPNCLLTWSGEVRPLADGVLPWPVDDRRVRVGWPLGSVVTWFVTLPLGALGGAAVVLSLANVAHGTGWLGWGGALVGVPLGAWVSSYWLSTGARFVLQVLVPDRVEMIAGITLVRVRDDAWRRSDVRFEAAALSAVELSGAQGDRAHVWLTHREGPSLLVTTLPLAEARTLLLRLAA